MNSNRSFDLIWCKSLEYNFYKRRDLDPYRHKNPLVRLIYLTKLRIVSSYVNYNVSEGRILDIGYGSGILLPLFSRRFKIDAVDFHGDKAQIEALFQKHHFSNIHLHTGNIFEQGLPKSSYNIIVLTNVLEHIPKVQAFVDRLKVFLAPKGLFIVSSPTEGFLYQVGRLIAGFKKPEDHYHDAGQISNILTNLCGFKRIKRWGVPYPWVITLQRIEVFRLE